MQFRELKNRSRDKLHDALSFPAAYSPGPDAPARRVRVRTHIKTPFMQGDLKGTNLSYAETVEGPMKLVVRTADFPENLLRGQTFMLSRTEGYGVDTVHPPYHGTITVEVYPLTPQQMAALESPEDLP